MSTGSRQSFGKSLDLTTFQLEPGTTLIEASAGTGKTYTLQYIVLDLLFKGLEINEILVVTFTEAATRELRDRIQAFLVEIEKHLHGVDQAPEPLRSVLSRAIEAQGELEVRQKIQRALLRSDEAPIQTIHGFCQRTLNENAFAADVTFDPEICTDTSEIIGRMILDFYRRLNLEFVSFGVNLPGVDELKSRARKLSTFKKLKSAPSSNLDQIKTYLADALDELNTHAQDQEAIVREFSSWSGKLNGASYKSAFFDNFEDLLQQVFTRPTSLSGPEMQKLRANELRKKFKKNFQGTEINHPFFSAWDTFASVYESYGEDILSCFDSWFVDRFNQHKEDRGLITYDDMILLLDRALQKNSTLVEQVRERYRAALVDEFQDTDSRQYSIFKTVFGDWEMGFFAMIGDPKQSIYRFRGADIDAYLSARNSANERYTLPTNYRSEAKLIEGVNTFFKDVNLGASEGENEEEKGIFFEPVEAPDQPIRKDRLVFAGEEDGHAIQPRLYEQRVPLVSEKHGDLLQHSLQMAGESIAQLLTLSGQGYAAIEREEESGVLRRSILAGDIAVLVANRHEASTIQKILRSHRVNSVLRRSGDIYSTEEAMEFFYFLRLCLNPKERWIHRLLISPLFGKSDQAMRTLSEEERRVVFERFSLLGREWKEGASVGSIWSSFLFEIGARRRILAMEDGERRYTNYLHLGELAHEVEHRDGLSPERLLDYVWDCISSGGIESNDSESPGLVRLESDEASVQIVTMHASKGLEYPIVFLPTLWHSTVKKISLNELLPRSDSEDSDTLIALERNPTEQLIQLKSEQLRLGYVAMTRAVHLCVYFNADGMPKPNSGNFKEGWFDFWIQEQRRKNECADLWTSQLPSSPNFLSNLKSSEPLLIDSRPDPAKIAERHLNRMIPDTYQITSYSKLARQSGQEDSRSDPTIPGGAEEGVRHSVDPLDLIQINEEEAETEDDALFLSAFPGGTQTGTCLHELMEACDFTESTHWESHCGRIVRRHFPGISAEALDKRVKQSMDLLQEIVRPEPSRGISLARVGRSSCRHEMEFYFPVAEIDGTELEQVIADWSQRHQLPYSVSAEGRQGIEGFLTGSIDLLFEEDERYYVLDWKTNSPLPGMQKSKRAYRKNELHAHMCHGRYYLQALIYTVATAAFLSDRLGDRFDFETHLGGFIYCFVRGLGGDTGWWKGAFSEAEIRRAGTALGHPFICGGGSHND